MKKIRRPKNLMEFKNAKYGNKFVDNKRLQKEFTENDKKFKEITSLRMQRKDCSFLLSRVVGIEV